ncbi:hypothetical protein JHW45_17175 [Paracoccus stylophorae]|uniref:Uncharacterized protein n=1 Tax=Paracoccus stylophorae TaxID=659350 RepID=A0ABY7SUM4_9RHOB|nr:hypothetical protein [Paracoccus stylophorae]WCR10739.1 hypothetical protein JHW45_17175 [Paracoccus stylophorae]
MKLWDAVMIAAVAAGALLLATADMSAGQGHADAAPPQISVPDADRAQRPDAIATRTAPAAGDRADPRP